MDNERSAEATGAVDLWEEYLIWKESPAGQAANRNKGLIGSPATLRERLHRWEETHVDQVILLNQAGMTTHKDIMESLSLFAKEVMPEFHGNEARHPAPRAAVKLEETVANRPNRGRP